MWDNCGKRPVITISVGWIWMMTSTCPRGPSSQQYFSPCLCLPYEFLPLILPSLPLSPDPISCLTTPSGLFWHTLLVAFPASLFFAYFLLQKLKMPMITFPRLPCSSPAESHLKILAHEMWEKYAGDFWERFPSWQTERHFWGKLPFRPPFPSCHVREWYLALLQPPGDHK